MYHRVAEGELDHEDVFSGTVEDLVGESFSEAVRSDDADDRGVDPGGPGGVFYPTVKSIAIWVAGDESGAGDVVITAGAAAEGAESGQGARGDANVVGMYLAFSNGRRDEHEATSEVNVFPLEGGEFADAEAEAVEGGNGVTFWAGG